MYNFLKPELMRVRYFTLIASLALIYAGLKSCTNGSWEPLFNGENLEGWTVNCLPSDSGKEYWSVQEASIVCNSMGDRDHNYVWLTSERTFTDFHLKLKFQVYRESEGNSGVQFRSIYDRSEQASFGGWLHGPQADIHGPAPFRTGLIYDETQDVQRWIHPSLPDWQIEPGQVPEAALETELYFFEDDPSIWNDMEIVCKGMWIETYVNGNQVSSFNGEGILNDEAHQLHGSGESGSIAFQLHMNDELKIKFKDILIKEL